MRLFILCISLLATLLTAVWCGLDLYTTGSLSWPALTAFLPAFVTLLTCASTSPHPPAAPVALPSPLPAVASHDQALFAKFQAALPYEPTIRTLREADFGADYQAQWLDPLSRFVDDWDDPNCEFLDEELELARRALYQAAYGLAMDFARETVPNDRNGGWRTVYPWKQRGGPRPAHVLESARVLNQASRAFVPHYDHFVRMARKRLNPTG